MPSKYYWHQATVKQFFVGQHPYTTKQERRPRLHNDHTCSLFVDNNWKWTDGGNTMERISFETCAMLYGICTQKSIMCPIPELFSTFVGYNVPDKSKHRKHEHCNLNYSTLVIARKPFVQLDATSKVAWTYITKLPRYEKLCVVDFCSVEPENKYVFVQDLKRGLTSPVMLYTCSLGSNLGNYDFVWRIPQGVTLEAATNDNIRVIDDIKKLLPTYSRALRRHV